LKYSQELESNRELGVYVNRVRDLESENKQLAKVAEDLKNEIASL